MPQWPHWYVLREWGNAREFDFVERLITKYGYKDVFAKGRTPDSYLVIGKFKYWVIGRVLNMAAPISNTEMRKRGERWLAKHGKIIGPYGHPIDKKYARRRTPRPKTR